MTNDVTVKLTLTELSSGKVHARIDQSPRGASEWPGNEFEWPEAHGEWFRAFMDKWQKPGSEADLDAEEFGSKLYKLVFDGNIHSRFNSFVADARESGATVRLALNLCGKNLGRIPFELLHEGGGFLSFSGVRIVRIFDEFSGPAPSFGPFRRLLLALAQPRDLQAWGRDLYLTHIESTIRTIGGIEIEILSHATKETLLSALQTNPSSGSRHFDAVHIVAHGRALASGDAELLLENAEGKSEALPANVLAQAFKRQPGCFAYLNSCSTALSIGENPFAGYAQRLMRDGRCGAVFAMQKPIAVTKAQSIATSFFIELSHGSSCEAAAHWAVTTQGDANSWTIPCLYTRLSQPDQERRDRIAAFFSADPTTATFAFFLPLFRMGYSQADFNTLVIEGKLGIPPKMYNYKGETHARSDLCSAVDLIALIGEILPPERAQDAIQLFRADELTGSDTSHFFLFGSRSHDMVQPLMRSQSKNFAFYYKDPVTHSDEFWQIHDLVTGEIHKVSDPSQFPPDSKERTAARETDYAVIEKIIDRENDRVFFVLAGLQDRGTRGAGEYLVKNWEKLVTKFGASPFQILLKFAPDLESFGVSVVDRKTKAQ
jgi:hypothetical protein